MMRCESPPFSGAQIQIWTFFFVWVFQSAGEGPARASNHWSARFHGVFSPLAPLFCCFSLSLSSSSSSPLIFAHFPLTSEYTRRREKKKRHKLSKSYWPTLPDLALGIHISAKEFQEQFFFPFPSVFLGSFSWRPFSSHQVFDPHMSTNSTLYKWINALQLHNWRFGARSPLLTVE